MFKDFIFYGGRFLIVGGLIYSIFYVLFEAPREKTIEICDTVEAYFTIYDSPSYAVFAEGGYYNPLDDFEASMARGTYEFQRSDYLKKFLRETPNKFRKEEYENKKQVWIALNYVSMLDNYRELRELCSRDWYNSFEQHVEKAYSVMSAGKELSITQLPKSDNSEP